MDYIITFTVMILLETSAIEIAGLVLQIFTLLAVIATVIVYYFQLQSMLDSSKGQNMIAVVNILQNEDFREARRIVIEDLKGKDFSDWTPKEKKAADRVCASYDTVAVLVLKHRLLEKTVLRNWEDSIVNCYSILEPYIITLRKAKAPTNRFWGSFTELYEYVK